MLEETKLFKAVTEKLPYAEIKKIIEAGADLNEKDSKGLDILAYAVMKHNDPEVIKLLVDNGLSFFQKYNNCWKLVHFAALNPNPQIMQLLLNNGMKHRSLEGENLYNPLMIACIGGSPEVCKLLIRKDTDLGDRDKNGYTPTMLAILHHNLDVLKYLYGTNKNYVDSSIFVLINSSQTIKEFAKNIIPFSKDKFQNFSSSFINNYSFQKLLDFFDECDYKFCKDKIFYSALAYNHNPEIIDFLMNNNFFKDNYDYDSMFSAIVKNTSVEVWKKFLEIDIAKDTRNSKGQTLLMSYVIDAPTLNIDILDLLADETTINLKDNCGANVYHYAVRRENLDCLKLLKNNCGLNVGHYAVRKMELDFIKFLKNKGANINERDNNGVTPLMYVCKNNPDIELVDCLIENGADINKRDTQGNDALLLAMENKDKDRSLHFFIDTSNNSGYSDAFTCFSGSVIYSEPYYDYCDCDYSSFRISLKPIKDYYYEYCGSSNDKEKEDSFVFLKKKYLELMNHLVGWGADIHTKNNDGENILMVALKNRVDIERINNIVSFGIDVNARNNQGIPTIFYAAKYNPYLEVFKLLVDKGAEINFITEKNKNILFFAAANRNPEIINYLFTKYFETNTQSIDYGSLLFEAARNSNINVIKFLFSSKEVDEDGRNLMHYLCKYYSGIFWKLYKKISNIIDSFDPNGRDNFGNTPILYAVQNPSKYSTFPLHFLI